MSDMCEIGDMGEKCWIKCWISVGVAGMNGIRIGGHGTFFKMRG